MKHLHTFTQHINENQVREIDSSKYWKIRNSHDRRNDTATPIRFTPEETEKLYDLYEVLDPNKNGSCYKKRNGRFDIRLYAQEDKPFPIITITKYSESEWLICVESEDSKYNYHETESLQSVVIYLTANYGPLMGIDLIKIK